MNDGRIVNRTVDVDGHAAAKRVADLACFGGKPSFAVPLHVGCPRIPDTEAMLERIRGAFDRAWLTNGGPIVHQFERQIARHVGVKHCICTSSGTTALGLVIRAIGLTGEVIVPSLTFVATAHALTWQHLEPVFVDVDPRTWNIDPEQVLHNITARTTGVIGVHLFGEPCDAGRLQRVAEESELHLLFDASHAFGCEIGGTRIGNLGAAEVFSFHATKYVQAAEGGAVVTNCDSLARRLRAMRNFGIGAAGQVESVGINGKMSELSAAVGLTCLEHAGTLLAANQQHQAAYRRALSGIAGFSVRTSPGGLRNGQYVVAEIDAARFGLQRNELLEVLQAENILARRYFFPGCHRLKPYAEQWQTRSLPHTEAIVERVLVLPNGAGVSEQAIEEVARIVRCCAAHGPEIAARLRHSAQQNRRQHASHNVARPYIPPLGSIVPATEVP